LTLHRAIALLTLRQAQRLRPEFCDYDRRTCSCPGDNHRLSRLATASDRSAPPAEAIDTSPAPACPATSSGDIVVCGKTLRHSYRLEPLPPVAPGLVGEDGRLRMTIGHLDLDGGGPMTKYGQSVGLALRFHF